MEMPGAPQAEIADEKVLDYLLSETHPVGRFKSAFFRALGFSVADPEGLRSALLTLARTGKVEAGQPSPHGTKFEVRGTIQGPSGRIASVVSVWIVLTDEEHPRFVTAFPG